MQANQDCTCVGSSSWSFALAPVPNILCSLPEGTTPAVGAVPPTRPRPPRWLLPEQLGGLVQPGWGVPGSTMWVNTWRRKGATDNFWKSECMCPGYHFFESNWKKYFCIWTKSKRNTNHCSIINYSKNINRKLVTEWYIYIMEHFAERERKSAKTY